MLCEDELCFNDCHSGLLSRTGSIAPDRRSLYPWPLPGRCRVVETGGGHGGVRTEETLCVVARVIRQRQHQE